MGVQARTICVDGIPKCLLESGAGLPVMMDRKPCDRNTQFRPGAEPGAGLFSIAPRDARIETAILQIDQVSCPWRALVNAEQRGITRYSDCENTLRFHPLNWSFLHFPWSTKLYEIDPDPI